MTYIIAPILEGNQTGGSTAYIGWYDIPSLFRLVVQKLVEVFGFRSLISSALINKSSDL